MKKFVFKFLAHIVNIVMLGCFIFGVGALTNHLLMSEYGINVSVITSGSMEPTLMTNSIVFTDYSVPFEDIKQGDIIEYARNDIHKLNIQHRAHNIYENENGRFAIMTKGDSYEHAVMDGWACMPEDYKGRVLGSLNGTKGLVEYVCGENLQDELSVVRMGVKIFSILSMLYVIILILRWVYKTLNRFYQYSLNKLKKTIKREK